MAGGFAAKFLLAFASMTLHELAHIFFAWRMGRKIYGIRLLPVGLTAVMDSGSEEVLKSIALYFIGPCVNFILFFIGMLLVNSYCLIPSDDMRFFILTNGYLGIFNLIPLLPMDGGKILNEIAGLRFGMLAGGRIARRISLTISAVCMIIGILQILMNFNNPSLFLIGLYSLIMLKMEKMEAAMMNVRQMFYRRSRLLKKGIYPARSLVVTGSALLGETLKNMDFDRFHIIYVLDENLKLSRIFTEQEIIEALLAYDSNITFNDWIQKENEKQKKTDGP